MDGKQDWEWMKYLHGRTLCECCNKAYEPRDIIPLLDCIRTLREALEFYADKNTWSEMSEEAANSETYFEEACAILKINDSTPSESNEVPSYSGRRARTALEKAAKGEFE